MAIWHYKAMNAAGRLVRGELEAINLVDLELRLKRMELDFINGTPSRRTRGFGAASIPLRERIHFCFHLQQLTRSGVPLIDALSDLRDSTSQPRLREVVSNLVESIEGGRSLSEAMSEHSRVFDPVFCALVRAGETTGNLPEVLAQLTESLKREDELAAYTRKLVIYPSIVGAIILSALAVSMVYVVPELAKLFRSTGQELPLQTQVLIWLSDFLSRYWWAVLAASIATAGSLRAWLLASPRAAEAWDGLRLRLPLYGGVYRKIVLARFAGLFAMMYASGIPIIDAIRTSQDIAGNRRIARALQDVVRLISEGQNVTAAFTSVGLFPPLVVRMLRVGENTGSLDHALANVSYFYDRDVRESIERLQTLIEPTLTLLLGGLLLWVMMSVLGPIYDVITRLKV